MIDVLLFRLLGRSQRWRLARRSAGPWTAASRTGSRCLVTVCVLTDESGGRVGEWRTHVDDTGQRRLPRRPSTSSGPCEPPDGNPKVCASDETGTTARVSRRIRCVTRRACIHHYVSRLSIDVLFSSLRNKRIVLGTSPTRSGMPRGRPHWNAPFPRQKSDPLSTLKRVRFPATGSPQPPFCQTDS